MKIALRVIVIIVCLIFQIKTLIAQSTANYTFTNNTNGSLTDINSSSTTLIGPGLDGLNFGVLSPISPIGFSFYFMSQPYETFTVTEDGVLRLGPSTDGIAIPPSLASAEPRLIIFGADLSTGTNGKVHYKLIGTAPNRMLVVEWKSMNIIYSNSPAPGTSTFQIRLYEGSGKIEYVYGYMNVESQGGQNSWSDIGFTNGTSNNLVLSKSVSFTGNDINRNSPPTSLLNNLYPSVGQLAGLTSSAEGARRVYTFTPRIAPNAPTFGTCTATTTSVTLNWNDNANNETGYMVYCSADAGANYLLVSSLAVNSVTYTMSNLASNQSYLWKVYAVNEGAKSADATIEKVTSAGTIKYSNATSMNWNTASSWTPSGVPSATDEVIIQQGHTVTMNTNAVCNNLTINGTLQYTTTNNRSLTIGNNLLISNTGSFITSNLTTAANRSVIIGNNANSIGSLQVNGVFDMAKSSTLYSMVTFKGKFNSSISGSGATCNFDNIIVNKGTDENSVLDVQRGITIVSAETSITKRLTITNGTFKISSPNSFCLYNNDGTATQLCASTGRMWLSNANANIINPTTNNQLSGKYLLIEGNLRIDAGSFTYGTGYNYVLANSAIEITGSNSILNINGQLQFGATSNLYMTNGIINLDPVYSGQSNSFDFNTLFFPTGCLVQCYGGIINFIDPPYNNATNNNSLYIESEQNKYFTGTKLRFGNGVSTVAGPAQGFRLNAPTYNNAFYLSDVEANNPSGANRYVTLVQHGNGATNPIRIQNLNNIAGDFNLYTYVRVDSNLVNNGNIISKPGGNTTTMYFGGYTTLSGSSLTTLNNVEIMSGYQFTGKLNDNFQITGNWTNNGTYNHNNGTVTFTQSSGQNLAGSSGTAFNNLTIGGTNTTIANITTANQSVKSVLSINGTFSICNDCLTLLSNATQTALLDKNMAGTFTGRFKMQRYISSAFGYKYFGIPFQSATVSQFATWCDLNAAFPRFYTYDQTNDLTGWEVYTTTTNTLTPLYGYAVNLGNSSTPTTVELKGNLSAISGVSRTLLNNSKPFTNGFNLVSNPYPTPINWNSTAVTRTNVDNAIYFFEAGATDMYGGAYTSYVNGVSTGSADNIIPSMQGFFVHATNSATGSLSISLQAGVNNLTEPFHKANLITEKPIIRLTASKQGNSISDGMVVYVSDSTTLQFNGEQDALKLFNTDISIPSFYTITNDNQKASIKSISLETKETILLPLILHTEQSGLWEVNCTQLENIPEQCLVYLQDDKTKFLKNLKKERTYSIYSETGSSDYPFTLIIAPSGKIDEALVAENPFNAWCNNRVLHFNLFETLNPEGTIKIFDMKGLLLAEIKSENINTLEVPSPAKNGMLIISFWNDKEIKTKKIIIQ